MHQMEFGLVVDGRCHTHPATPVGLQSQAESLWSAFEVRGSSFWVHSHPRPIRLTLFRRETPLLVLHSTALSMVCRSLGKGFYVSRILV